MIRLLGFLSRRAQKEGRNPLPFLTPQEARCLYELYRKGQYADVMLCWAALEETDDMLGTVLDRRASALAEMTDDVKVDAKAIGNNPDLQTLADEQQQCLAEYYGKIDNLRDAVRFAGSATFRGFAHLEPVAGGGRIRMEPVDQWLMARPVKGGNWYYNESADRSCAKLEAIDESRLIIRECLRPVDLPSMFAICAKAHALDGWDGFIDVFGNPAIFFKYPPGTSDEKAREFDRIAEEMIGDGRGGFPDGGDIKTVETTARGGDTFKQRCEWCDKQIVRRGTGGELTVLAESGSGTLAGNAHQETFRMLAAGEGAEISESFNRQLSRRLLDHHFPRRPHLAYWTLEYAEPEDVGKQVDNITKLAAAGYIADEEEVSEASGYTVTYRAPQPTQEQPPSFPLLTNRQNNNPVGFHRALVDIEQTRDNAPLTAKEKELLEKLLNAQPSQNMIRLDAARLETAMKRAAGLEVVNDPENGGNTPADPRQNANSGGNGGQENLLANYGTSEGAKKGWDKRGRGQHEAIGQAGTAKSLGLEKLSELKPDPASSHSHTGRARKALTRGFSARSVDGQDVQFSKGVLDHWEATVPPKTPEEQNRRLRRLSEAVRAVKDPHEVWESHNGQKTYLRVYKDDAGKFAMSGFVAGKDGQVRSFFHSRRLNGAEKMRKGTLKYKR
ncbi:phage portal protein family protein [Akkermansia massiliensis]|nr:DUF935 family protein [Akkermansia massiliensis]